MWALIYNGQKIFNNIPMVDYEDNYFSSKGNFKRINLFSNENSDDIKEKIVEPMVNCIGNNVNIRWMIVYILNYPFFKIKV